MTKIGKYSRGLLHVGVAGGGGYAKYFAKVNEPSSTAVGRTPRVTYVLQFSVKIGKLHERCHFYGHDVKKPQLQNFFTAVQL